MELTARHEATEDAGETYSYLAVPLWYRLAIALPIAFVSVAISLSGLTQAWRENSWLPFGWAWPLWMAIGLPLAWGIYERNIKKVYATVRVPAHPRVRRNRYLFATGVMLLFLIPLLLSEQFSRDPLDIFFTCICPVAVAYAWAMVSTLRHTTTKVFTKSALIAMQEERAKLERANAHPMPSKAELLFERVSAIWWVRYLFGFALLWGAWSVASTESLRKGEVIIALALAGCGVYCMREVFGWLIGAAIVGGIFYAIAGALAGIPVSVAIIVGAIIIANSKK